MTIIFFGSDPWFSQPVLAALVRAGHNIPIVVTKGEALLDSLSAIRKSLFVQATSTEDITKKRLQNVLNQALGTRHPASSAGGQQPAAIVLASFGPPFLGDDLLDWPTYGCLNVHASLLPRWRGASPVCAAIAAGDIETGVTIMKMTREIDRGPILGQRKIAIHQPVVKRSDLGVRQGPTLSGNQPSFSDFDTRESLTRRLGVLGGKLIVDVLGRIGQIRPMSQTHNSPTPYTYRLKKEDGCIDWTKSPEEIERFIRAMSPWPSARTSIKYQVVSSKGKQEKTIKDVTILKAHLEWLHASRFPASPAGGPLHASLVIDEVQLPGKKPVTWKQFTSGHPNTVFG